MWKILIFMLVIFVLIYFLFLQKVREFFVVNPSRIQGIGVFSTIHYLPNKKLFKAINKNKTVTPLGSKINHCNNPTTYLVEEIDGWYLYSNQEITDTVELTVNYNDTPDFIAKPDPKWTC